MKISRRVTGVAAALRTILVVATLAGNGCVRDPGRELRAVMTSDTSHPAVGCFRLVGERAIAACREYTKTEALRFPGPIGEDGYRFGVINRTEAFIRLGDLLAAQENWAEALEAYRVAWQRPRDEKYPKTPKILARARTGMGLSLFRLGRSADAVPIAREATRLDNDSPMSWAVLGLITSEGETDGESCKAFSRAEALDPAFFKTRPGMLKSREAACRTR